MAGETATTNNLLFWLADKGQFAAYFLIALKHVGIKKNPREEAYRLQVKCNRARLDRHRCS